MEEKRYTNGDQCQEDYKIAQHKLLSSAPHLANASEWDVFKEVFEDTINLLVENTNLYAQRDKNDTAFSLNTYEIMNFLGLLFMSRYNYRTNENDYWSTTPDLCAPLFAETMSRQKFRNIKRYLHACDNQNFSGREMAKIIPLYDFRNKKLQ